MSSAAPTEGLPRNKMAWKQQDQARTPEARRPADRASRFIARVDAHLPTLANDGDRRAFLDRQLDGWEHRYAWTMADDNRSLSSAILSLLVAADQRCPAIIGQAHLLYHARSSAQLPTAAKTLVQLKRDTDDLVRAIAEVEAAMKQAT